MLSLSIYRAKTNLQNHKNRFLLDADHQALLESCRTILQNSESQTYLEEANWPDIIKNLKPSAVMIDPNQRCMDIMAGGGFYMFGVIALQKESSFAPNASPGGFQYTKLIDGLWYYEE
jgi:hypothetical protein